MLTGDKITFHKLTLFFRLHTCVSDYKKVDASTGFNRLLHFAKVCFIIVGGAVTVTALRDDTENT